MLEEGYFGSLRSMCSIDWVSVGLCGYMDYAINVCLYWDSKLFTTGTTVLFYLLHVVFIGDSVRVFACMLSNKLVTYFIAVELGFIAVLVN